MKSIKVALFAVWFLFSSHLRSSPKSLSTSMAIMAYSLVSLHSNNPRGLSFPSSHAHRRDCLGQISHRHTRMPSERNLSAARDPRGSLKSAVMLAKLTSASFSVLAKTHLSWRMWFSATARGKSSPKLLDIVVVFDLDGVF